MLTFTLGDYPYTSPGRIGLGRVLILQSIMQEKFQAEHPESITAPDDQREAQYRAWVERWSNSFDGTLTMLESFLTPAEVDGPSVRDGFLEASTQEVAKAAGFFKDSSAKLMSAPNPSPERSARTSSSGPAKRSRR